MNDGFDRHCLQALCPQIIDIAHGAGEIILEIYKHGFTVTDKPDHTPVTEADLAANRYIQQQLGQLAIKLPVLSEEVATLYTERTAWPTYWLIDPLDGTKEFIKKNGEFGVNIALVHHNQPILGVVFAPVLQRTYFASRGNGAFKLENGSAQPIKVSAARTPLRICASRSHPGRRIQYLIDQLPSCDIVNMGSSLKSCLVAEGVADLYPRLGRTSEWDTGACQVIVTEAGGQMLSTKGRALTYNRRESLINPEFIVFGDANIDWLSYVQAANEVRRAARNP